MVSKTVKRGEAAASTKAKTPERFQTWSWRKPGQTPNPWSLLPFISRRCLPRGYGLLESSTRSAPTRVAPTREHCTAGPCEWTRVANGGLSDGRDDLWTWTRLDWSIRVAHI